MYRGYVKLWRRIEDKGWYSNSKYVHLWIHLLLKANHLTKELMWNKEIIIIKSGQVLTGRKKLSEETGLKESTIENILKTFENEHQIEQQKTTKFRLITILNWKEYQPDEQQNRQQSDNRVTTNEQQSDTNKNDNNYKNEKEIQFSDENSLSPLEVKNKTPREFANARRKELGKEPLKSKTNKKQKSAFSALKLIDYFKDEAMNVHRLSYLRRKEDLNPRIRKQVKSCVNRFGEESKNYVDWFLNNTDFDWTKYEPTHCFSAKFYMLYENRDIKLGIKKQGTWNN